MTLETVNTGGALNAPGADSLFAAFTKLNNNTSKLATFIAQVLQPASTPMFGGVTAADAGVVLVTNGTGDNRAALNTLFTYAASRRTIARLPEGELRYSGGELVAPIDCMGVIGPGSGITILRSATSGHHGFRIVGTFAENQYRKRVEGFSVLGPVGAPVRTINGWGAVVHDRCPQVVTKDVVVDGFDIGIRYINNCFNSVAYEVFAFRTGVRSLNVFIYLEEGPQSGSDNHFYNCQGTGLVGAVIVQGAGGGNHFYGGSYGTEGLVAARDIGADGKAKYGVWTFGYDYLRDQVSEGSGNNYIEGVHCEGWRQKALVRGYGDSTLDMPGLGANPSAGDGGGTGPTSEQATYLVHWTNLRSGKLYIQKGSLGPGRFSGATAILLDGDAYDGCDFSTAGTLSPSGAIVGGEYKFSDWLGNGWEASNFADSNFAGGYSDIRPEGKPGRRFGVTDLVFDGGMTHARVRRRNGPWRAFDTPYRIEANNADTITPADYMVHVVVSFDATVAGTVLVPTSSIEGSTGIVAQVNSGAVTVTAASGLTVLGRKTTTADNRVLRWIKTGNQVLCS